MISYLNRPFPERENQKAYVLSALGVGSFIAIFLYVFKPFGLHRIEEHVILMCLGYGLVTFATTIIYDLFIRHVIGIDMNTKSFTLGKWILITLILILCIGIANYFFMRAMYGPNSVRLLNILVGTLMVGLFPLIFVGTIAVIKGEKRYEAIAKDLNHNHKVIPAQKDNVLFDIATSDIRYIKAMQNYLTINFINEWPQKEIVRHTLSSVEEKIPDTTLIRCHRSYIVNLQHVEEVTGNAQGLKLKLKDSEEIVPVSRSYVATFRSEWQGAA